MSIAEQERDYFDAKVRNRGAEYFRNGRVELVTENPSRVTSDVHNNEGDAYSVTIRFDADGEVDGCDCECPYFDDFGSCKHVWATILQLDSRRKIPKEKDSRKKAAPEPEWKRNMKSVLANSGLGHHHADNSDAVSALPISTDVYWYVIDVAESASQRILHLDFLVQQDRANGQPGTIKSFKLSRDQLNSITDPAHHKLMTELLSCLEGNAVRDSHYDAYWMRNQSYAWIQLRPLLLTAILPKIADTGRLFWRLSSDVPAHETRPATWDRNEPWKIDFAVREKRKDQQWVISANLIRRRSDDVDQTTESRPVSDVIWLDSSGVVLFPDSVSRIDMQQNEAWLRMLLKTSEVRIPFADRESFLRQLAVTPELSGIALPQRLSRAPSDITCTARLRLLAPDKVPHRMRHMKFVFGNVEFVYPDKVVSLRTRGRMLWNEEKRCLITRDTPEETRYLNQLTQLGVKPLAQDFGFEEIDIKIPQDEMPAVVRQLIDSGWLVEAEGVRLKRPGTFSMGVTSGVDWFELNATIDFEGISASLPDLLQALRSGENFVRLSDGSRGMLPEEWLNRYGRIASMGEIEGDAIRFKPSQAMVLDALLDAQDKATRDHDFSVFCRKLKKFSGIKARSAPKSFCGELRDYQKEGLGWLHFLDEFRLGGCLADDMGLGKTIQVLAFLDERRNSKADVKKPSLVVVPKSLVFNWMEEAKKFVPTMTVINHTGLERHGRLSEAFSQAQVIITTYGTLRNDIIEFQNMEFDYVILDEAQAIKNPDSISSKACRLLKGEHRLAMTGTPIENHLGELWSLFEFLNPGMLGSSAMFQRLTAPHHNEEDRNISLKMLSRALQPFLLRRTKAQVLTELPGKTEQTIVCEMPAKQKKLYGELRDYYRLQLSAKVDELGINKAKIHVLEALLRLRQAACHPGLIDTTRASEGSAKIDAAVAQLKELASEGHKALVFSQFTSLLSILKSKLDSEGIRYEYLDGKTRNRQERVESFQTNDQIPLFLISLKAGGHGLNLTAADYVFILDPWWNPAVEAQAVDRAHRMGQDRHVFAYRLICKDTVEERILQLQKDKKQLADAIISADSSLISSLTAEDLQLLLT